ncbi:MAG: NtaA/DmoA family FMN-dependent monooxygenase [Xenophilus sp.]
MRRKLKLGAVLVGVGDAVVTELWRHEDVPLDASANIDWYIKQAVEAEQAKFDFVFIVDSQYITPTYPHHHLNRLEPLTLLSAVAVRTRNIGLIATVSTTYGEPFDTARRLASLDLISGGRAGWNIVTSQDAGTAGNFSRREHGDYDQRYRRADEAVQVVLGLWSSYEEGAFATDRKARRFLDPGKQHRLDHVGEFYSVTGPLNVARSPQGHPPLVQAGTSEQGKELSAKVADVAFSFAKTKDRALALNEEIRRRARRHGGRAKDILFMPALSVIIGDTDEQARRVERARFDAADVERQLHALSRNFSGHDFTRYDLDAPFPDVDPGLSSGISSFTEEIEAARRAGASLREVLQVLHTPWLRLVGSPGTVADAIEDWYASTAADGFNVFVHYPEDWRRFREEVVPLLRQRGVVREEYEASTLRGNLGLPIPAAAPPARARAAGARHCVA